MEKRLLSFMALLAFIILPSNAQTADNTEQGDPDKLVILWTSDDPYVAERVTFMYTHAAKTAGWFKDVTLIVWGPSAKLITENVKLQEKVARMMDDGVEVQACIACANAYGVADKLKKLGYEVKGMGKPLTDYLKSGAKVLTF
ncbi:MAG: DsrE family protein [Bacteroidales bacterium]|nr:DsrE family protein [Bacteroidales bacterium]